MENGEGMPEDFHRCADNYAKYLCDTHSKYRPKREKTLSKFLIEASEVLKSGIEAQYPGI